MLEFNYWKTTLLVSICLANIGLVNGFLQFKMLHKSKFQHLNLASSLPPAEENAKALEDYMVKAHEEKLRCIRKVEDEMGKEILNLKKELEESRKAQTGDRPVLSGSSSSSSEIWELRDQLESYQTFMAEYIVQAQLDKYRAVKETEEKMKNKYSDKMLNGVPSNDIPTSSSSPVSESSKLYLERNEKVKAAAKEGKSRWGDAEVNKVQTGVANGAKVEQTQVFEVKVSKESVQEQQESSPPPLIKPTPEIIAADHGIKREGSLSLAERVILGKDAISNIGRSVVGLAEPDVAPKSSLYSKRNNNIAAAAKAGRNSRWGDMEIAKATKLLEDSPIMEAPMQPSHKPQRNGHSVPVNIGAQIISSS